MLVGLEFLPGFEGEIKQDEPMSRHTTWKTGGPAELFLVPRNLKALRSALARLGEKNIPCFVLGNGSNLLISDLGIAGAVIKLGSGFQRIKWGEDKIWAGCGIMLSTLVRGACRLGLGDLSFLAGIPGSLGGALIMNAGAYGGEIGQLLNKVKWITRRGEMMEMGTDSLDYAYRKSAYPPGAVLVGAELRVNRHKPEELLKKREEIIVKRRNSHPDGPSAGSTFKNPPGYKAWELIDKAGLRGLRRGALEVSAKHPNFIINHGGAKSGEIWDLMQEITRKVEERTGLELEPEIKRVGRW